MTRQGVAQALLSRRHQFEALGLAAAAALLLAHLDLAILAAGLGLFLWGMTHLQDASKRLSGGTLDRWLASTLMNDLRQGSRLMGALTTA